MERILLPHLNTQTNSNLSFSFLKIPQLVNWASENKLRHLAIADYYPYEIIDFLQQCKDKEIKPIWGIKVFFREKPEEKKYYSATIYPQNNKGYKEVMQKLFAPDSPVDRIFALDFLLSSLSKNCFIVFEAQKLEEITYFASQWIFVALLNKEVNYDNLFIGFNFFLLSPASSLPSNVIPLLLPFFSVKTLTTEEIKLLALWKKTNFNRYFLTSDTQGEFLAYLNTEEYFPHCTDDQTFYQLLLIQWQSFLTKINLNFSSRGEKVSKTKKENNLLLLKSKCWQKLLALRKDKEEKYQKTLEKELKIIEKFNYVDYLLIFSDVVNHLKKKNIIVGPGRGSSVSSLVAYLLGITSIDPLQHKLFFERFLNEKRKVLPDIDLDVEDQEEVFNYLQQKYLKKQVARIVTRKKIGWKNACKEVSKIFRVGELKLKEIASLTIKTPSASNWKLRYPDFFNLAESIENLYYDTSIHPAGVVISEQTLVGNIPLRGEKSFLLALFEEENFSQLGLKKYDFLSLKETLSLIREARELISINFPDYQRVKLDDPKTWELLNNFLITGIFQLDTPSSRILFNKFRPQNFAELTLFLALNRPGTKKKVEEITQKKIAKLNSAFTSPSIREILSETYDSIVFEEQMSQIFSLVYDCSFADAEIKRRELKEKGLEEDFLSRAGKKMSSYESKLIYNQIIATIGYTFNKSHAIAYGYLTYYLAYLKANFFSELIVCFLNKGKEKTLLYLQEAFFYDFQIKGPDINHSELKWTKRGKELIMGFNSLKEYNGELFQIIIEERRKGGIYKNWESFLTRTISLWEKVEVFTFSEWIKAGLFFSLGIDIDILLQNQEAILRYLRIKKVLQTDSKDLPFLNLSAKKVTANNQLNNQRDYETLGLYISYFSRWKKLSQEVDYKIISLLNILKKIEEYNNRETVINIYAVIFQIENKEEKNYTLLLQDIRNSFKLNVSSEIYQKNKEKLVVHSELLFTLKIGIKKMVITSLDCKEINTIQIQE